MSYLCELDLSGILFYYHTSLRLVLIAPCVKAMKKRATGTLLFMAHHDRGSYNHNTD